MSDLTTLRAELDAIDDTIHDLLMRRVAVVQRVAARKAPGIGLRPGREAAMLRRLLARHAGPFPPAALIRIWREMLAGSVSLQGPFAVAVSPGLAPLAQAQFGLLTTLVTDQQPLAALRRGLATVAVLPMPGPGDAWWTSLAPLHVVARLPFWGAASQAAFVVAPSPPDPSGDDHTLVAIPEGGPIDWPGACVIAEAPGQRLADLPGWIDAADPRLAAWAGQAQVIGAYATLCPPSLPPVTA